jgi:thiol:disulfide interchange protein
MKHALPAVALAALASMLAPAPAASRVGTGDRGETWRQSESVAFADARASGRHLVVVFGADWCLPCEKIEQIMNNDSVFGLLSESFVPLHFDITELSDHDEELQERYRVFTLPAVIFVDAAGRELGRWDHSSLSAESFIDEMRSIVVSHPLSSGVGR